MSLPPSVGQRLKDERERRNLQRVDVSRATKIYIHHLAAIEFGRYDDLPDGEVVEAYVRAYGEQVGLDGEALVRDLREERGLARVEAPPARPLRSKLRWGLAAVGAVLLILAAAVFLRPVRTEPPLVAAPPAAEPPPPPEAPLPEPPAVAASPVVAEPAPGPSIAAHGVGTGVVDHRLIGAGDRFPAGSTVWFWTDVRGGVPGATVRHLWIHEGRRVVDLPLRIGGAAWRTQSSRRLDAGSTGEWTVEARNERGDLLVRAGFRCVP